MCRFFPRKCCTSQTNFLTPIVKKYKFTDYFPEMTKLLVASGLALEEEKSVEIVNLDEENPDLICDNLPNLPIGVSAGIGHLFLEKTPIICGGFGNECSCQIFRNDSWITSPNPSGCRTYAASTVVTNSKGKDLLFISGGSYKTREIKIVETFDGKVWNILPNDNLHKSVAGHCIVKINSSTLMSIGGLDKKYRHVMNTYLFIAQVNKWTQGPYLKTGRSELSCSILIWKNPQSNQLEKIVVAGGGHSNSERYLSSVELLHLNDDDTVKGEWLMGSELPKKAKDSSMIEYNNSVILVGGSDGHHLYQLSSPNGPWIKMKQTLKQKGGFHVSFLVPDELVNCHK